MILDWKNSASCFSCMTAVCVCHQLWFTVALSGTTTCLTYFHVNEFEKSVLFLFGVLWIFSAVKKHPAEPPSSTSTSWWIIAHFVLHILLVLWIFYYLISILPPFKNLSPLVCVYWMWVNDNVAWNSETGHQLHSLSVSAILFCLLMLCSSLRSIYSHASLNDGDTFWEMHR